MSWTRTPGGWAWTPAPPPPKPPSVLDRARTALQRDTGCKTCNGVRKAAAKLLPGPAALPAKR